QRGAGAKRHHRSIEEGMAVFTQTAIAGRKPVQEIAGDVCRNRCKRYAPCIEYPDLLIVIGSPVNGEIAPIGRKLHRKYCIGLKLSKVVPKAGNRLRRTERLPAASLGSSSQHKAARLLQGI